MGKVAGYKAKTLGIWYDKGGGIKRIDTQGMTLKEIISELNKKIKEGKNSAKRNI